MCPLLRPSRPFLLAPGGLSSLLVARTAADSGVGCGVDGSLIPLDAASALNRELNVSGGLQSSIPELTVYMWCRSRTAHASRH